MSVASILKVYDGLDPELVFTSAGTAENIAQVLANAPAGVASGLPLTDVGAFSATSITHAGVAGLFTIDSDATSGISVVGAQGASLIATTGGCKVEASEGILEINWDGTGGELNVIPVGAQFTDVTIAAGKPTWVAAKQLQIQVGGVNYWIPMGTAAFA